MTAGAPLFFLLGASHRSAPMEMREQLYIPEQSLESLLPLVRERHGHLELAALSTCNRFEVFGVTTERSGYAADLYETFLELHRQAGTGVRFTEEQLRGALYLHLGDEAVQHVYRVAASLDSLVLGETQITGQFKDALALAVRSRTIGPLLSRLGQEALATAKKVRTQTAIGEKHVSIAHAALELAKKVFGDLSEHRFLVVGAGEMAGIAARYIQGYKPKSLMVANRTLTNAQALVRQIGFGEACALDELPALLTEADVVVCSTAATGHVIDVNMVRRAQAIRRGRPVILLDIALPRDIDPACAQLDDVYLFDIDDLQQVVGANTAERHRAAEEAEQLIRRGVEAFRAWQRTLAVKPALAAFHDYVGNLVRREGARTLSREMFKDLPSKQREALEALLTAIAGKISADAARRVTAPPAGYYPEQLADALGALFGIGNETTTGAVPGGDDAEGAPSA